MTGPVSDNALQACSFNLWSAITGGRVDQLRDLYPQPGMGRPSVMYVPLRTPAPDAAK
jgi:hypothetical protein